MIKQGQEKKYQSQKGTFCVYDKKYYKKIRKDKMEKFCEACGMPLSKKEDFAGGDESSKFCLYCVNDDASVKSCEEIFEGGVQFFLSQIGDDRQLAERITRKNMKAQPYWQDKNCAILDGEVATDEEFAEAMRKIHE